LAILPTLFCLGFAVFIIREGILQIKEGYHYRRNGILTEGIVESVQSYEDDDSISYKLMVKFNTNEGLKIEGECSKSESYYHSGIRVHILYDSEDPHKFKVNDPKGSNSIDTGIIVIIFGCVFGIFGIVAYSIFSQ
jgi:Protein of unknown function (DUF3592)